MTLVSWNCRGLAADTTIQELRDINQRYKPAILFLMETRATATRVENMQRRMRFPHSFCVAADGRAGGLCLFWNNQYQVRIMDSCKNFIHTVLGTDRNDSWFNVTWVYGNPTYSERRKLWSRIAKLQVVNRFPWLLCGDFNEMIDSWEKQSCRDIDWISSNVLREFMDEYGLMDLEFTGCKYTWLSNPRDGLIVKEKLDRVMANWEWRQVFPRANVTALPIINSDHSPVIIDPHPQLRYGNQFRYEIKWDEHPDCKYIVQQGWNQIGENQESPWNILLSKITKVSEALQCWDRSTFKHAAHEIQHLKRRLTKMINNDRSEQNSREIQQLRLRIASLWRQEEQYWYQRSRVKWLNWGDRNTKFFHATTIQRRDRNSVTRIKDDAGNWREGTEEVLVSLQESYGRLYSASITDFQQEVLDVVPELVTSEDNRRLLDDVTMEEIKAAAFSMGANKAPGPDGLSGLFYQKHWEVIKQDVFLVVQEFFTHGRLPSKVNETLVALIPKVPLPENIGQLRPISCCNYIYKIISKIVVARLKRIMDKIITPNQSAFVGGRLIQDNILVTHEVLHFLQKDRNGKNGGFAIKLDMSKAYDRVEWTFLKATLTKLGFARQWIERILQLVSSVSYKYQMNGLKSNMVTPSRGLRQGDPLSPYLFILVFDVLSRLIREANEQGIFEGVIPVRQGPAVTHMFFADDAIIFSRADPVEAFELKQILNMFSKASGQRVNLNKSGLICGSGLCHAVCARLEEVLGIARWENPGKYLGIPAVWGSSKVRSLQWLQEKILNKMQGWKELLLSQGGKEVLIKAVVQAIPIYTMAVVKFPKVFCQRLNAIVSNFWWRSNTSRRGIHWKSWDSITRAKNQGGLGFKEFEGLNNAMLAKQAWRLIKNPESVWAKLLLGRYCGNKSFWEVNSKKGDSWMWSSLLHGRDLLLHTGRWHVSGFSELVVDKHLWLSSGNPVKLNPISKFVRVRDLVELDGQRWNPRKLEEFLHPQSVTEVSKTPLCQQQSSESFWWPATKSGDYTVRSGYHAFRELSGEEKEKSEKGSSSTILPKKLWVAIWETRVPQKIKCFVWKLVQNALSTKEALFKKKLVRSAVCPICDIEMETQEHLFLLCGWTRAVWFGQGTIPVPNGNSITSIQNWLLDCVIREQEAKALGLDMLAGIFFTLWNIWKARNNHVFNQVLVDPSAVLFVAKAQANEYVQVMQQPGTELHSDLCIGAGGSKPKTVARWRAPIGNRIKMNSDACWLSSGEAHGGLVARNSTGGVEVFHAISYSAASPLLAEAIILREAVIMAANLGFSQVVFESDNLDLIQACRSKYEVGEIKGIVHDIKAQLSSFSEVGFTWVGREGNKVAHEIAKLQRNQSLGSRWCSHPPAEIQSVLQCDVAGNCC